MLLNQNAWVGLFPGLGSLGATALDRLVAESRIAQMSAGSRIFGPGRSCPCGSSTVGCRQGVAPRVQRSPARDPFCSRFYGSPGRNGESPSSARHQVFLGFYPPRRRRSRLARPARLHVRRLACSGWHSPAGSGRPPSEIRDLP